MDGHGKTILVAEDHESNRKWLALLLEHAQYEVHLSTDGYAALDRMLNGVFDAVIMDWDIPGLNGSKFLALGQTLWLDTPVIMVSAHTIDPGEGIHQRAFAWLRKPYESQELLQILHTALQTTAHCKETWRVMNATIL